MATAVKRRAQEIRESVEALHDVRPSRPTDRATLSMMTESSFKSDRSRSNNNHCYTPRMWRTLTPILDIISQCPRRVCIPTLTSDTVRRVLTSPIQVRCSLFVARRIKAGVGSFFRDFCRQTPSSYITKTLHSSHVQHTLYAHMHTRAHT